MKYNFDEHVERRGTASMKWDGGALMAAFGFDARMDEDTIPIFTADMDIACPPQVVEALHKVCDRRIFGYTTDKGEPRYAQAVVRWFRDRHNWEVNADDIMYVDGTVHALNIAVKAFTQPGDGIIITRPVYGPFTSAVEGNGRALVNSQLINTDGYYTMDFADIEEKAKDPNNKMFILCSPHNPTGRVWTKEELQQLADICKRNNVLLVSDEVHCDLIRVGQKHYPAAAVADPSNIVMLTAVNKTFNMAGLKCSNAIISEPELKRQFKKELGFCMPTPFAIEGCISAYTQCDDWVDQICEYFDGTFDWVLDFISKNMPKVKAYKPEGTYVLWMDFSGYGLTPAQVHQKIYYDANVALEGGDMFDPEQGHGYERVCLSSPRPLIREAFERIALQFKGL